MFVSLSESPQKSVFHGTPIGFFDNFDTTPVFFTNNYGLLECSNQIELRKNLENAGYDGVIYTEGHSDAYIVFSPDQVNVVPDSFKDWFDNSKAVDPTGEPLILYHGTAIEKTEFRREGGAAGLGAYFTADRAIAQNMQKWMRSTVMSLS